MEPFSAWIDFQAEMVKLQRSQLAAAQKAVEAGGDMVAAQKAMADAAEAGARAWKSWFRLWGLK
ncbi:MULTISPECIES: hypothetical protein [Sphingomonadales]|nr:MULTISPECIES: hypothetical protein [Sphingomonas]AGH48835.1 hypothetical protein G432_05540 [Sphingomonas sp. MM-1]MDX3885006.1 hypothetical protein [Sphingomonas sp.]OHT21262.1 hypothetical protein BHE75_03268 [Sphingomonas haloaromaticamans]